MRHPRRGRLSHAEEMVLLYGPEPRWPAFRTEAEHRDAWMRNRDRLLAHYRHGRRPMAWWRYETDLKYPGYDREQATLFEAGLLSDVEAHELQTWWRAQFERAQKDDFWTCLGPGQFLHGSEARRAHHRWMDVPRNLLRKWTRERRHRNSTIRALEAATQNEPHETA